MQVYTSSTPFSTKFNPSLYQDYNMFYQFYLKRIPGLYHSVATRVAGAFETVAISEVTKTYK